MFEVEAQGDVFQIRQVHYVPGVPVGGGLRGRVLEFSQAARRRLINFIARFDVKGVRTVFLTLTFHNCPSQEVAKVAFKRFAQWLRRHYPQSSAVWRLEFQQRGAIHFHLLCFNLPYIKQADLQRVWERCTEEDTSIVYIQLCRNKRDVMGYVSKYVAKRDRSSATTSFIDGSYQHETGELISGRCWGYINKKDLPLGELVQMLVEDEDLQQYTLFAIRALSKGKGGRSDERATLYSQDGLPMLNYIVDHAAVAGVDAQRILFGRLRFAKENAIRAHG